MTSVGEILWVNGAILFLGPVGGIALARWLGGSGRLGGAVAGVVSGITIALRLNAVDWSLGMPFSWLRLTLAAAVYVAIAAFCGWLWGRQWDASRAKPKAAKPEGDGDWGTELA